MARIEFGVIVGTAAALFFPFMSQAFVQSTEALYGVTGRGTFSLITPLLSLAFGAWTLLMVFFFYRRRDKEIEALGKLGSAIAGVVAVHAIHHTHGHFRARAWLWSRRLFDHRAADSLHHRRDRHAVGTLGFHPSPLEVTRCLENSREDSMGSAATYDDQLHLRWRPAARFPSPGRAGS